jgi:ubiquinone/menaquinone biosynthesis C-methylase UbiE
MAEANYPITTTADEFTRLRIQADLFREDARAMLAAMGQGSGLRVLDLCCGAGGITDVLSEWVGERGCVVGADLDAAKLDRARRGAEEKGLFNVDFMEANAFDTGFEPASFDLAHTRFAVSVIENGLGILDHMLTLVRPGGLVFVEEANTHTMECSPPLAEWDRALALMQDTFRAVGADTAMGLALRGEFLERGLTDIRVRPCLHAQTSGDPMTMHLPLTLTAMTDAVVANGLMGRSDLQRLVARVAEHLAKPETMTVSFTMVQVVGRLPT